MSHLKRRIVPALLMTYDAYPGEDPVYKVLLEDQEYKLRNFTVS